VNYRKIPGEDVRFSCNHFGSSGLHARSLTEHEKELLFPMFMSAYILLNEKKGPFGSEVSGDYFVSGIFTSAGEYPGFCVMAGVVTTIRFLHRVQAASRASL
jgi:hypothetical protein